MCGILGVVAKSPVNQLLYDGLLVLQHRGQDAAGIATEDHGRFHMHKGAGLVSNVFRTRNMRSLTGNWGIGHVRYPTAGSAFSSSEAQPFYVNSPFGITLAHNGNLTNTKELQESMFREDLRHINTSSDSEVLLNVLAHELQNSGNGIRLDAPRIFDSVAMLYKRCKGAFAAVAMIAGYGLLAFRDSYGIRPLVIGKRETPAGTEWLVSSESVALDVLGFELLRDVLPGEAVFIDHDGKLHSRICSACNEHAPCMFEFVYLARPDSFIDGVSVYDARIKMGAYLAEKFNRQFPNLKPDVIVPVPDSSRPAAMEMASRLGVAYREGFVKNRYIGRTFIMPGQTVRRKSVRQKLNAIACEFKDKIVLIVDDSIVRGTTSQEIVSMAREAGAKAVYLASAAPPVRYANVYGIDMPNQAELIAANCNEEEIARKIGADGLIYQDLDDLIRAVKDLNPALSLFETSCFDGCYVTGDITVDYLDGIAVSRKDKSSSNEEDDSLVLDISLAHADQDDD